MALAAPNATDSLPPIAIELCKDHPYYLLAENIWRVGALLCVLLGMPGHIVIVLVMLNSRNRKQPVCLYFATIAVFEFIFLIIVFWLWCSSLSLIRDPRDMLTCGTFYSLIIGSSNISTLLLTAASIDRFCMVVYPGRSSTFVTRPKALTKIAVIVIVVSLLIIQYHFAFYFSYTYHMCDYYSYAELWHGKVWPVIRLCLLAFLPCIITCMCSMVIMRNRYYRRPSTTKETTDRRHMRTASLLLVIYSIYYTVSVMPMSILQFFHAYFFDDDEHQSRPLRIDCLRFAQWKLLMKFCLLLMTINYSNKIIVHYLVSRQFRRDIKALCSRETVDINNRRIPSRATTTELN